MRYHDCNLHLDQFSSPISIINEYDYFKVNYLISLCDNFESFNALTQILKDKKNVFIGLGLHPNRYYTEKETIELLKIMQSEVKIIGECGLDYSIKTNPINIQVRNLKSQLEIAEKYKKKIIVHVRKAESDLLEILNTFNLKHVIIHWYSGTIRDLERLVINNYYFSFGIYITFSKKYQNFIKKIPLRQLLLESDAPYLFNGIQTKPEDFKKIVKEIAKIKSLDEINVINILNKNFKSIFLDEQIQPNHHTLDEFF